MQQAAGFPGRFHQLGASDAVSLSRQPSMPCPLPASASTLALVPNLTKKPEFTFH